MMPSNDGDQVHLPGNRTLEHRNLLSPSIEVGHVTSPHRRSWRWRIPALLSSCTLLLFLITKAPPFLDSFPTSNEIGVQAHDQKPMDMRGPTEREQPRGELSSPDGSLLWRRVMPPDLRSMESVNIMDPQVAHSRLRNRRILVSSECTNKDISIFQSEDGSTGMPRYAVQIMNNCMSECAPSDIHVFCGWFASALLVNPNSFKRVAFNDCLVNGGLALRHGETLRFTYANSFMYPLRFKSASFCK